MTALRSLVPAAGREDAYDALLAGTRGLRAEQRTTRDEWFQRLTLESKEDILFELEVLLKATACFSNPRNHPGPLRRAPIVTQDFREATLVAREGLQRGVQLVRQLLGERDRAYYFHRYLETVLPEDNLRGRLVREGVEQESPEQSLVVLRHLLASHGEIFDGVLRAQRVPFRLYYALLAGLQREIGHNAYFNPLTALEFRPEFDRIKSVQVLELIRAVPEGEAHRLVALSFLSLFRMLRYLRLLQRISLEGATGRRGRATSRAYLVLSVLRSDGRALGDYLRRRAGTQLARGYQRELFTVPRARLLEQAPALRASGHRLLTIKSSLESVASSLRLELRRAFQHELPALGGGVSEAEQRARLQAAVATLRPALRNAILYLGKSLGVSLEEGGVFDDVAARRETSERLRRDVWMFAQILRAFSAKVEHSDGADRWSAVQGFQYIREFLGYFRAMGYPLLRAGDYPKFEAFMQAMAQLEETDLVDPARLQAALRECLGFQSYLTQLFEDISRRDVLEGVSFDRRAAALALKLYLGA